MVTGEKILNESQLKRFFTKMKAEKDKSWVVIRSDKNRSWPNETRIIMDYYILSIIANCGLRVSEALNLRLDDIYDDFIIVRADISKNNKKGTVFFGNHTKVLIHEYHEFRSYRFPQIDSAFLFPSPSSRTGIISRSYLHTRFKEWLKLFGMPESLSIHSLRHTYATLCLDKGLGLTFVRDQLRHTSIGITSKYLHLTKENRAKVKDLF